MTKHDEILDKVQNIVKDKLGVEKAKAVATASFVQFQMKKQLNWLQLVML